MAQLTARLNVHRPLYSGSRLSRLAAARELQKQALADGCLCTAAAHRPALLMLSQFARLCARACVRRWHSAQTNANHFFSPLPARWRARAQGTAGQCPQLAL